MFFLLRMAFWLGLVLVLLPRAKTPESEKLPQVSVSDAVQAATAAVTDMSQFCKRQPQACQVGSQAATVIGVRAQDGARKIYDSITEKQSAEAERKSETGKLEKTDKVDKKSIERTRSPEHTGSIGGESDANSLAVGMAPPDTLTQDDLAVAWQGVP